MENIFHRVSIRKYEDKPVEKEKILQILKAGMQAPSACNQQPWEFYVVTDKEKILELSKATPYSGCAAGAPVVIVPVYRKEEKNFGEALVEAFGPDKADVIYDCAGNNITMGQAIQYARKGSVIVLVAVFADMATVDLAVANDHELDIKSTMMYRHDDYVDAIDLVNAGKVHLKPLISKTFKFKDYLKAYQYIDENRETTMKVIINVQEK